MASMFRTLLAIVKTPASTTFLRRGRRGRRTVRRCAVGVYDC